MATKTTKARLDPEMVETAAKVLRVLAHPHRILMVELLLDDDYAVGELAEELGLAPAAVSQHLNLMRAHGIVEAERIDRSVYYRVVNPNAMNLVDCLRRHGSHG